MSWSQAVAQAPDNTEWMSLGVFALSHEEKGEPTMFFQLAVAKDGTIAGTVFVGDVAKFQVGTESRVAVAGDEAWFLVEALPNAKLWRSDGKASGTWAVDVPGSARQGIRQLGHWHR